MPIKLNNLYDVYLNSDDTNNWKITSNYSTSTKLQFPAIFNNPSNRWDGMFADCQNLVMDLNNCPSFDYMSAMNYTFQNCGKITGQPKIGNNSLYLWCTYNNCPNISGSVNIPPSVSYMYGTFDNCRNIGPAINFKSYFMKGMSNAFRNCKNILYAHIPLSLNCSSAFQDCSNLSSVDIGSDIYGSSLCEATDMFRNCYNLTYLNNNNCDLIGSNTFANCYNFIGEYWDYRYQYIISNGSAIDISYMFFGCNNLNLSIYLNNAYNLNNLAYAFYKVKQFMDIYLPNNCNIVNNISGMFSSSNYNYSTNLWVGGINTYDISYAYADTPILSSYDTNIYWTFNGNNPYGLPPRATGIIMGKPVSKRCNFYVPRNSRANTWLSSQGSSNYNSVLGYGNEFWWQSSENCYYNSANNIYVYYNLGE